jgi:hypothetical protein
MRGKRPEENGPVQNLLRCTCEGRRVLQSIRSYDRKRHEDLRTFRCEDCGEVAKFVVGTKGARFLSG